MSQEKIERYFVITCDMFNEVGPRHLVKNTEKEQLFVSILKYFKLLDYLCMHIYKALISQASKYKSKYI